MFLFHVPPPKETQEHSRTRTPINKVMEFTYGRSFLGHHYYILNLSAPCPRVPERKRRGSHKRTCYGFCMINATVHQIQWK